MHHHHIECQQVDHYYFEADIGQHRIGMDAGSDAGGQDRGASPKKLMLASLAGCTGIDVVSILEKMKVSYTGFRIHIEADLTDEHPKIYNQVRIRYEISLAEADRPKMERAVQLSMEKYCGVSAMF
ncbi:MAG TPA: OsmC family protein, partial [Ferruginibacter sp.]|nr:OsmC family protein [Ferruginibacter sp.]